MQRAQLFEHRKSQAVRLPDGVRFDGAEVYVVKVGDGVLLLPLARPWQALRESLGAFGDDFMSQRAQPAAEEREGLA
ncbi:MAG TPA: type II toxin-antitoxin system VapB family antitoxin [Polyangiaceae bacterium]|nr:type II toxin-antitoxin system VapB family antitoxin [Polyangiaceae bacterium]